MNTVQTIAKNTASLFAAQFVVAILGLVLSIFIARSLGDVIFGKYSFALAFTAIFAVFSDLGYNTLLIREVARDKSQAGKYLNNILCIRALLSLIIFALIVITINVMGYPADTKNVIYLFGIYTLVISLSAVFKVTFRAFEKMEYEAGITIFANIIRVSLGLLILFLGYGLIELALVFIFSGIFDIVISFLICERRFVKPKIELDLGFLKSTIKIVLPLTITALSVLMYTKIDIVMLSAMKGDAVVGWYSAANILVLVFTPIPQLFMNSLFPLMSIYSVSSRDSSKIISEKSFKYLFLLALPLALGITLLADKIILLFYGQQFSNSIIALQILAWNIILFFLWFNGAFILVVANKQNLWAVATVSTALVNIIANLLLIPPLSHVGAAIATIISGSLCVILVFYFVFVETDFSIKYLDLIKALAASLVMGIFVYQFKELNLISVIILAAVLYFFVLYLIRAFSDEDMRLFKQIIRR